LFFSFDLSCPVAKFIVPDWGDKVNSGILGCRTGPPVYCT
jgi:hypothetical protein